ncbi:MAG TPA: DapH/DapD/GlmU-related protein [Opitutaceae bacterium]|nr:DapH/DapD/GlmU-related protein [Opitutaceae bacterium]
MTFGEFRALVRSDIERFAEHTGMKLSFKKKVSIFFMPSLQAIFTYRLSRYLYLNGWRVLARMLFTYNIIVWGTDIPPLTRIGGGFYMPHTIGVTIFGNLGDRCTCYAQAAIGGGSGDDTDIGAGRGLPVLGDNVLVGARAMVVGPVRVGSGSLIGANAFVTFDVPPNSTVVSQVAKII